ncbi:type II toxin-antitoxin system PemK/MazF family toxin [Halorubrum trapanicum]|uniref:type II toxin-antitoxin system PemK/MazF family toxin n=1 Tax=Halorubrum trapanicum TaxID=29284 RepID=UPI000BBA9706|nr:type II toxin-antitoxin system PemK/MazF family toxin [Halorubrum trapanicum]
MEVRRGDVVIVDLDPTEVSEQRGTRPCLVVQNDVGNENAPTTIAVPFTAARGDDLYPFEVLVEEAESPLREESVALCSQVRTVSIRRRIRDNIGSVPASRMEEVDEALRYSLGLREL